MSDETAHGSDTISPERQKILDDMRVQMCKSRAKIDQNLLEKVKDFIFSNPTLRKSFGVKKQAETHPLKDEPIDRSKNMDVIAKFLEMNPDRKKDVSRILKD